MNFILDFKPQVHEPSPSWWLLENTVPRQRLTFIKKLNRRFSLYECECGKTHQARPSNVRNGFTRSCGCWRGRKPEEWHRMKNIEKTKRYYTRNKEKFKKYYQDKKHENTTRCPRSA